MAPTAGVGTKSQALVCGTERREDLCPGPDGVIRVTLQEAADPTEL